MSKKSKRRKRKNKHREPERRRKRMRRPARLIAAVTWWSLHPGEDLVASYARWFGVDPICAITELRMLGVEVAAEHEQQIRLAIAARAAETARRRGKKQHQHTIAARSGANAGRRARKRAAQRSPREVGWRDDLSAFCSPFYDEGPEYAPVGAAAWISTDEDYDDLAWLEPTEWAPTDEDYDDLASIGPEWAPTDEEEAALASIAPVAWIATEDEHDLAWLEPTEWAPTDEDYDDLASIGPEWAPTDEEEAALASIDPVAPAGPAANEPTGWLPAKPRVAILDELPL